MSPAIWLAMARDDLRAAELLVEHGLPPLSRMHADHAVEKALRAFYLHRERQADEELAGSTLIPMFPYPSVTANSNPGAELSRREKEHPLPSRLGEDTGWIAAALASLSLRAEQRQPASEDVEAELAREAVQVAHQVLDRITDRVYGDP
jgi:HEPN domain-containing protein